VLSVNVRGTFVGTQAAAADVRERDAPGVICNTAPISSNHAQHGQVAYDTSKGAVRTLTRGASLELAGDGIRVNAAPGRSPRSSSRGGPRRPSNWSTPTDC